jgi:hypothetical protein
LGIFSVRARANIISTTKESTIFSNKVKEYPNIGKINRKIRKVIPDNISGKTLSEVVSKKLIKLFTNIIL